jgi:hypothetical protein
MSEKVQPEKSRGTPRRMRTTIVVEYETQEDLNEGLEHGLQCARERYIGIRFGLKGRDEHGPKIEVRTARCRRAR